MLSNNFDIIKNQSTLFTSNEVDCKISANNIDYKNIVNADDLTQVQFELSKKDNATQQLFNSEFTTALTGWTATNMIWQAGGYAKNSSDSAAQLEISPSFLYMPFGKNAFMQVELKIDINTHGVDITIGSQQYTLNAGQTGVFTYYGMFSNTYSELEIIIYSPGGVNHNFRLDYVRAYPIDINYVFLIRNMVTDTVEYVYKLYTYFDEVYTNGNTPFRVIDNNLTWSVDWSTLGLTDGCYRLEVADPNINTNLQNGFPNQDFNYYENDSLDYDSAAITAYTPGDSTIFIQQTTGVFGIFRIATDVAPAGGIAYTWSFIIQNYSATNPGSTYYIGFTGDNDTAVITGNGTYSGSFTSDGTNMDFSFVLTDDTQFKVSKVILTLADTADYEPNYISNQFFLTDDECNTLVLHGCSDADYAFNLNFGSSSYSMRSRVEGRLVNANYDIEKSNYEYGTNNNVRTSYFKRRKFKQLKMNLLPEYMLDFVTALIGLDHIYIDNVEYALNKEEAFSLTYDANLDDAAYATLFLFELESTIENKACIELGVGCSDTLDCVIDPEDDTCVIDPQTNDELISLA